MENQKKIKTKGWKTAELKTKGHVTFTPKQDLKFEYTDKLGYRNTKDQHGNFASSTHDKTKLTHTYTFDKMMRLESEFNSYEGDTFDFDTIKFDARSIKERLVFNFSDYFFKNDYVKATKLELAPEYAYVWAHDGHNNHFGLYANAEFDLPYGVTFQAEFDDLFAYDRTELYPNGFEKEKGTFKTSSVELTLGKEFEYVNGPHKLIAGLEGKYETGVFWNAKKYDERKVQKHEFTFEPTLKYEFKATDYVTLWSKVGAEFKYVRERVGKEDSTSRTRSAQPYAEVGFKTTF